MEMNFERGYVPSNIPVSEVVLQTIAIHSILICFLVVYDLIIKHMIKRFKI